MMEDQMNSIDSKSQHPDELQAHDPDIAQLKALIPCINPYSNSKDRDRVLMALYDETNGSEDGLALAIDLYCRGDGCPSPDEIRSIWQSLESRTDNPETIQTLRDMATDNGFDLAKVCGRSKSESETQESVITLPAEDPPVRPPQQTSLLDKYSLKGMRSQLVQDAVKQMFALESFALTGQATVLFGSPNTGKTLVALHAAANAISRGNIDPVKLYYCNADDSQAGLLDKLEHADKYGYHTIAEGHQGFSTGRFLTTLDELTANDQANGVILILDTGKKFFDPMSKRQGRAFGRHIRLFVMKGGTIIVLSHTNKHRDSEGKPIYAGTSDIVEDFDCAYIMYEVGINADAESKTILLENIKNRGNVARQASYRYSIAEGLSYGELIDSVEPVDGTELSSLKQVAELEADAKVIAAITQCILDGIDIKMQLADASAKQSGVSKRAALKIIEKYTGSDPNVHSWNYEVHERGAKKYRLLDPITTGTDPVH